MRLLLASLLAATAVTACTPVEDELATEDTTEVSEEKADSGGTYTYFTVRPDFRRCAYPYCGGFWVERVNRTTTKCADGTYADACYVYSADWSKLRVAPAVVATVDGNARGGTLVVRATIKETEAIPGVRLGQLRPTEAWIGQGPHQPEGVFVKIEETGVRCFTTPCPFFREHKLNGSGTVNLAELGWDDSGVPEDSELIGNALAEVFTNKLIIAGDRFTVRGPGGTGKARTVTQFYVRATDLQ